MIDIITIFCLAYIITTTDFPLVVKIKNYFGFGEDRTMISDKKWLDNWYGFIHKILNCPVCMSFCLMLLITFNINYAIISYVAMTFMVVIIDYLKNNTNY